MLPSALLLDACVAINLAATDRLRQIAQATCVTFTLARQAAAEAGYLRDLADGEITLTPIGLSQYDGTTLEIVSLAQPEYSLYVDLARTIDDGEAATIAIAVTRSLPLATDDRKARRVCADLHLPEPSRTLGILHSYADAASLPQAQIREILVKVRDRASFQPPRNDPDLKWWQDIMDDQRQGRRLQMLRGQKRCAGTSPALWAGRGQTAGLAVASGDAMRESGRRPGRWERRADASSTYGGVGATIVVSGVEECRRAEAARPFWIQVQARREGRRKRQVRVVAEDWRCYQSLGLLGGYAESARSCATGPTSRRAASAAETAAGAAAGATPFKGMA